MHSKFKRYFRTIIFTFFAALIAGYGSDLVSLRMCERRTASWIAFDIYQGQKFFTLKPKPGDLIHLSSDSLSIFKAVGAHVQPYTYSDPQFDGFPWGDVHRAAIRMPFVVSVEYGYVEVPTSGSGGTKFFFCLFGFVIPVSDHNSWVT
jgi:hypothetical protein